MKTNQRFELWLETEIGDLDQPANRPTENFCNVQITLEDGRRYALNLWTFDFLPFARHPWPYEIQDKVEPKPYLLPPDLFVERLDRETLELIFSEMLENGEFIDGWLISEDE